MKGRFSIVQVNAGSGRSPDGELFELADNEKVMDVSPVGMAEYVQITIFTEEAEEND